MPSSTNGNYLTSAGIDIGTTSTHLAISRLQLSNQSVLHQAPRLMITGREILYQSAIHFTPLKHEGMIDAASVSRIVSTEYERAGVTAADVETGAVIITGETARLRNAAAVTHALAEAAGSFVVASAGPNLEAVLAGRGSGAAQSSAATGRTIVNVDIGGGTTNIAVFANGQPIDTACLAIGGRCLRLSRARELLSLSDSGELFLDAVAKPISPGSTVADEMLELLGTLLAETIVQFLVMDRQPQVSERLLITANLRRDYTVDEYWFSGGVAELILTPPSDPLAFGDIGAYMGQGLLDCLKARAVPFTVPDNPIRATVIGAGSYSLQLSGSTVTAESLRLPLRNVPIVRPFAREGSAPKSPQDFLAIIQTCLIRSDLDWSAGPLAVVLEQIENADYDTLKEWATGLASAFVALKACPPMVVVTGQDLAMALGQLMRKHIPDKELVVLDGINPLDGDYIDIGKPVAHGQALPVVVKSLIFIGEPFARQSAR